nr:hypothetical protein [Rhodococcus qingshengii]
MYELFGTALVNVYGPAPTGLLAKSAPAAASAVGETTIPNLPLSQPGKPEVGELNEIVT